MPGTTAEVRCSWCPHNNTAHLQEAPDVLYQVCIAAAAQLWSFRLPLVSFCSKHHFSDWGA